MASSARTLLLLRHAQTEDTRPGGRDHDRRLTPVGEEQARQVGRTLAGLDARVDTVLCSDAVRTKQTLDLLGLDGRVELSREYYDGGADALVAAIRAVDADRRVVLLIGHAPGVPAVAYELADPEASDPTALASIQSRFPPATLARLEVEAEWADLAAAALVEVWLPAP